MLWVNMSLVNTSLERNVSFLYPGAAHLLQFNNWYKQYHGYLATAVCICGIIANILNIAVLTRKNMVSSINCILTGLAVSDGLTMAVYLPFALWFYVLNGTEENASRNSLTAVRFMLFYAVSSVLVHTASIWLTVTLAIFRFIFIRYPHQVELCSLTRAKVSVLLTYLGALVVCVTNLATLTTHEDEPGIWIVGFRMDTKLQKFLHDFNFWIQAILVKLVPCVGLTILSCLLVHLMRAANQRSNMLRGTKKRIPQAIIDQSSPSGQSTPKPGKRSPRIIDHAPGLRYLPHPQKQDRARKQDRKTQKTTVMLLMIVLLFLLTEFPQGVLSSLNGLLPNFVTEVYVPLGDIIDILTLVNNGINFLLYCTMSKQFRDTFLTMMRLRCSPHVGTA